jgi:chemotaxis protein CheZ
MLETTQMQYSPLEQVSKDEMLIRVGQMTRMFHDTLRSLGIDQMIKHLADEIPDARERLNYVAKLTEQSAGRVLNATEIASPLQDAIYSKALSIEERWKSVLAEPSLKSKYNQVAEETLNFLHFTKENSKETKEQLMEIMMAQDFQDLTGQVIKRVTFLVQQLENQLIQILVEFTPTKIKPQKSLLNSRQDDSENVGFVATQKQVDDLLGSLGF